MSTSVEDIINEWFSKDLFMESIPDPGIRRPSPKPRVVHEDPEMVKLRELEIERYTKVKNIRASYNGHDNHILTDPLIELSSVSIHLDDDENPCFDVYGCISLVDDDRGGVEYPFFNHKFNNPVAVNRKIKDNQPAMLHRSQLQGPFLLPRHFKLKLKLIDKVRDVEIIDAVTVFDLDYIVYDKQHKLTFYGNGNMMVTVNYTLLRRGLLACVALTVLRNHGRSIRDPSVINDIVSGIEVGGTISATTVMESGEEISRVIFDPEEDKGMYAYIIPHTTLPPVAVPGYSFLRLKADLVVDGQPFVSDYAVEFIPKFGIWFGRKEIAGPNWRILVVVSWACPHVYNPMHDSFENFKRIPRSPRFDPIPPGLLQKDSVLDPENPTSSTDYPPEQTVQHSGCGKRTIEGDCFLELTTKNDFSQGSTTSIKRQLTFNCPIETNLDCGDISKSIIEEPQLKKSKVFHNELLSDLSNQRIQPMFTFMRFNRLLVEVFSISIGSFGGSPLQLYGKISSYDLLNVYDIFKRDDKMNPAKLHPHTNVLQVEQPHCYEASKACFGMLIDLKDVEGREISRGYFQWDACSIRGKRNYRICSIVRGKHGFAAVHYTIFEDGVSANLKVTLLSEKGSSDVCRVHGKIWGSYSTYKYEKVYEKEYYRSLIFEKDRDECVEVQPVKKPFVEAGGGGGLPLSKYRVGVPMDASFIVEVELNVEGEYGDEVLRGIASLNYIKPKGNEIQSEVVTIEGRNYSLLVCVGWC